MPPAPPAFANSPNAALAPTTTVSPTILLPSNTGLWQYAAHSFIHPLALEVHTGAAYLLDAGRVLSLSLTQPLAPQVLLQPGSTVAGLPVVEPVDLSVTSDSLLVLDRAGDVYAYDFWTKQWRLDRYDRAMRPDSANHYFVAVAGSAIDQRLQALRKPIDCA